jgi:chromate transporter
MPATRPTGSAWEVFGAFLRLGLTSFGGPVAHLGYFRTEFVERRGWLAERPFGEIVALCQFLPGPASSQVGMAIGLARAGVSGLVAAWCGFTLPSAAALVAFALGVDAMGGLAATWLHGLKVAAVAVVALAVWSMARALAPDRPRGTLAVGAAVFALAFPGAVGQVGALLLAGGIGWRLLPAAAEAEGESLHLPVRRRTALVCLSLFFGLLLGLPALRTAFGGQSLALVDSFYRSGALVFGGGHVVLPLLQAEVVGPGWIGSDAFLAGYGAAQAVPGPLFTVAAYLGAAMTPPPNGIAGAVLCLLAIFLPSPLLVMGVLPFWGALRRATAARSALAGVNAAVVGLLLAALFQPMWTGTIHTPVDFGLALTAFMLLHLWKTPPWLVVVGCAGIGALLQ